MMSTVESPVVSSPTTEVKPDWMTKRPYWWKEERKTIDGDDLYETMSVIESLESGDVTMADGIANVYELNDDGHLTITDHNFRRVVVTKPDGTYHIAQELLLPEDADKFVANYNANLAPGKPKAEAIDYIEAWRRARAIEWRRWQIEHDGDASTTPEGWEK